jgi:ribosomal protein L7/L12
MANLDQIIEDLSKLTVVEAADLVKSSRTSGASRPPRAAA